MASTFKSLPISASALGVSNVDVVSSVLPTGAATSANQVTTNTSLSSIDSKLPTLVGGRQPVTPFVTSSQNVTNALQATENGALNVGNAYKKFRDGFADLAQGAPPDPNIWDVTITNPGSTTIGRAGNAQGSAYMKISMCPFTVGSEVTMTTKRTFKYPMRFISMMTASSRALGQECEISIVGVDGSGNIVNITPISDNTISGSITTNGTSATVNFVAPHNLRAGDRVYLINNADRRVNIGPAVITIVSNTQITVPTAIAAGTYAGGGIARVADPIAYAKNGAGILLEGVSATAATFMTRRNGSSIRTFNSIISTTTVSTFQPMSDAINATSLASFTANQEEFTLAARAPDSATSAPTIAKWSQGIPDEETEYKIRIRAKNLDNFSRPIAKIVSISKTGTTTATVTTDVPHGLVAIQDWVQIYGVRDGTNFPNLTTQANVLSVLSPTQFTVTIGSAATASSNGGAVFIIEGSALIIGPVNISVQSVSRSNNILTLIGNGTWPNPQPGETVQLIGCDATSMGLYDGAYRVLRTSGSTLELESSGPDFASINCGGSVMRRADYRIHAISQIEHTRLLAELSTTGGGVDISRAVPVSLATASVTTSTGSLSNLQSPTRVTDFASAAVTTTTTTAAITPTFGTSYDSTYSVTAVSGTNPTLDVALEESTDGGTTWFKVYDLPRITAAGVYRMPTIRFSGSQIRYVQTVGGVNPSFTRSVVRQQGNTSAHLIRSITDRTINPNTLSSTTPTLSVEGLNTFNLFVRCTAQTTAATIALQFSQDGTNWHTSSTSVNTVSGTVSAKVTDELWRFARAIVTSAGSGITLAELVITGDEI